MSLSGPASDRFIALFILGIILLNPPFILIFDRAATNAGVPVLFLYLFVAWAILIALMALIIERSDNTQEIINPEATTEGTSDGESSLDEIER